MKIGIFGGSFNPIHNTHVKIIKHLLNKKIVDKVWLIPCKKHSFDKSLLNERYRIDMIKLSTKGIENFKICYIELKSKGKSYMINSIMKLKRKYKHKFFLIIGSDILYEIKRWHNYKQLLKEIEFIMFERKDYPIKKVPGLKVSYKIKEKPNNISSTEIREILKKKKSLKDMIPSNIIKYIIKKRLYK